MKNISFTTTKWMTALALAAATIACAKKRDAAIPSKEAPTIFAKDEFGSPTSRSFSIRLGTEKKALTEGEKALAINEKDLYFIDEIDLHVPARLKPLFKNLDVAGEPGGQYRVVFAIDGAFVTAYRVTHNGETLSMLDKQLATTADQVVAEIEMQRTAKSPQSRALLMKARDHRWSVIAEKTKQDEILVPLFKIKHDGVGVIVPEKDKLGQETTNLVLEKKGLSEFTHVKLTADPSKRIAPATPADDAAAMKDLFLTARLNGLKTNAGTLLKEFAIDVKRPADEPVAISFTAKELVVTGLSDGKAIFAMPAAHVTLVRPDALADKDADPRVTHLELREGPVDLSETGLVKLIRPKNEETKKDAKTGDAK